MACKTLRNNDVCYCQASGSKRKRALEKRDEKDKNIGCTQLSQAVLKILFAFTELLITLPSIVALTDW